MGGLRHARTDIDRAQALLRDLIVRAFEDRDGYTVDDIAEAAGLTRQRIYQIVEEAKA